MKTFIKSFLIGILSVFMYACQSELGDNEFSGNSVIQTSGFEISPKDATKGFSHTPTGVVYVETPNGTSVEIDFSCSKELTFQASNKHFILLVDKMPLINTIYTGTDEYITGGYYEWAKSYLAEAKADTVSTLGQLITVYNGFAENHPSFRMVWYNWIVPHSDADIIYSTIEYLLAQACFQDDCSSLTRKAVLKMAVEKQTYKLGDYQASYEARKSGLFLMTVIMVKEKYIPFMTAVNANSDLQNTLRMSFYNSRIDREFSDLVSQHAIKFLLN